MNDSQVLTSNNGVIAWQSVLPIVWQCPSCRTDNNASAADCEINEQECTKCKAQVSIEVSVLIDSITIVDEGDYAP